MSVQDSIIRYTSRMVLVGLAVIAATTFYWKETGQVVAVDPRTLAYFQQYSEPDCRFKGAWHDWERDEWMTLAGSQRRTSGVATALREGLGRFRKSPCEASTGSTEKASFTSWAKTAKGRTTILVRPF
jgi:hypothetical protein